MTTPANALALVNQGDDALQRLPASKADQIRAVFIPMAELAEAFDDDFNAVMAEAAKEVTPDVSARARRLRLDIAKVRVQAEHARKDAKAEYLLASQAIDGTAKVLKWAISEKEEALEAIEKHAERMEAERIERLQEERAEELLAYVPHAHEIDLGTMPDDVWAAYLASKRQEHEDRLEAERIAEEERKERERVEQVTREREREVTPVFAFFEAPEGMELGELPEEEYAQLLNAARAGLAEHEAEQARIREENARLAREKEAAEKKAAAERKKRETEAAKARKEAEERAARAEAERQEELARIEAQRKKEREEARAREAKAAAEREKERKKAEAERARLAALVEGAPAVVAASRALLDELPKHAIARNPDVRPLIEALRDALDAADPVDADEEQLVMVEA
jgi:hypothetical protein